MTQHINPTKLAYLGLLTALSAILAYLESLLPFVPAVPGMKIGLCNLVIAWVLLTDGPFEAALVSFARILLVGFLFGSLSGILYSAAGAACSLLVMTVLKYSKCFSALGISAGGGAAHNLGQLLAASCLLPGFPFMTYLPWLLPAGVAAGSATGLLLLFLRPHLKKMVF